MNSTIQALQKHEIPGRVAVETGAGGLAKIVVTAKSSRAEIYPHGAHVTHFQKNGEPPLLFLSRKSWFAPNQAIRGGVPICFPWFGNRAGGQSHGFARVTEWQLVKCATGEDGTVFVHLALPQVAGNEAWKNLRTEFIVTVADTLMMDLIVSNDSCDGEVEIENCLHSYFQVGDIDQVRITGLEGAPFDDFASGANGARRDGEPAPLKITRETNRVYPNHAGTVEIHDDSLNRIIRVEKYHSQSTVVWNPWTTQKLPDDFDPAEHKNMVCVESGNVKQNKIVLGPGKTTALKVVLQSRKI